MEKSTFSFSNKMKNDFQRSVAVASQPRIYVNRYFFRIYAHYIVLDFLFTILLECSAQWCFRVHTTNSKRKSDFSLPKRTHMRILLRDEKTTKTTTRYFLRDIENPLSYERTFYVSGLKISKSAA